MCIRDSDLANNYGNLCQRVLAFCDKNANFEVPEVDNLTEDDKIILNQYSRYYDDLVKYSDNQDVNSYINFIVEQLFSANKYFNDQEPWKKKNDKLRMNTIIYVALELIRKVTILLYPIIPSSSLKVLGIFGINEENINFETIKENNYLKKGLKLNKLDILFKKIEKND